ncbi:MULTISPECIES: hypothetical protein [Sneathiella]|uniref:hypothetical protein n=1 Tax=Sneathiella TaxID=510690 RepID=UPI00146F0BFD|nr:hypothetical protein [Sneathiella aquimaris]
MQDTPSFGMPDMETKEKLDKAAQIITESLDGALQKCLEEGLEREFFNAGVVATLMQAMETSLGGSAQVAGALQEMARMAAESAEREAQNAN